MGRWEVDGITTYANEFDSYGCESGAGGDRAVVEFDEGGNGFAGGWVNDCGGNVCVVMVPQIAGCGVDRWICGNFDDESIAVGMYGDVICFRQRSDRFPASEGIRGEAC